MISFNNIRRIAFVGLIALGLSAGAAHAGYGYGYGGCHYKTVVSYVCKQVPYTKCVTLYDHCGHPYTVHKTYYKTVHVPVKKLIKVCY